VVELGTGPEEGAAVDELGSRSAVVVAAFADELVPLVVAEPVEREPEEVARVQR
jgi:hypothetical protein